MRTVKSIPPENLSQLPMALQLKLLKEMYPDIYHLFFKKIYDQDPRFGDWHTPLLSAAMSIQQAFAFIKTRESDIYILDEQTTAEILSAQQWAAHDCPMFFIEPDLFDACAHTKPPEDLTVGELCMPFEAMTFVFPRHRLEHRGNELQFVMVRRFIPGITKLEIGSALVGEVPVEEPCLFVDSMFPEGLATLSTVIDSETLRKLALDDLVFEFRDYRGCDEKSSAFKDPHKIQPEELLGLPRKDDQYYRQISREPDDRDFVQAVYYVIINLLLAMEVKPEIVERERKIKHLRRDARRELWKPNVVGRRFRIEISGQSTLEKGEHASPRTHWRRGHWRSQGRGHRLDNCVCVHSRKQHMDNELCLVEDCRCIHFRSDERRYESYERRWIMPMLICGDQRKDAAV